MPNPPLTELFTSPMMGYSMKYPAGWTVTPATQIWRGEWDTWNQPNVDKLDGGYAVLSGTSEPLAPGQSAAAWIDGYLATASPYFCGVREQVAVGVGGQIGVIDLNGCASYDMPGRIFDLAVVAGGRGYSFYMEGNVDHTFFLALLATVTFSPSH